MDFLKNLADRIRKLSGSGKGGESWNLKKGRKCAVQGKKHKRFSGSRVISRILLFYPFAFFSKRIFYNPR